MQIGSTVVSFAHPEAVDDPLTSILRDGACRFLAMAVEMEGEAFLASMKELKLDDGLDRVVRHGHGPERTIQTGVGPVPVSRVKLRDRGVDAAGKRITFTSAILPKWSRRTKSLGALLPVLYLRGVSTGDFQDALAALLGKEAPNLSPSVIGRLKEDWKFDYDRWQRRDLSAKRYVYVWADGVYLQARMEETAACMLVIIGATPEGKKELVGFQVGVGESTQSWREVLVDLKARGLAAGPEIAVGDGVLGFWKALDEIFPNTRHQRCWVHKIANLLNKVPKSVQPNSDQAHVRHKPRLLSDNGPSYIAGELAEYIEAQHMSHVRGAPFHPQTQGKIERWHQTLKNRILLKNYFLPGDLETQIEAFVEHDNHQRYHESLSNVAPADAYFGRAENIIKQRERIKRQTIEHRRLQHRKLAA